MTDTSTIDPTKIAELAEQIAQLEAAQRRREDADATKARATIPEPPRPSEMSQRIQAAQDAARKVREAALVEADQAYAAQLASVQSDRERLEARLLELAEKTRTENERHAEALAPIGEERETVRRQLDRLAWPRKTYEELLATPERRAELARIGEELKSSMQVVRAA